MIHALCICKKITVKHSLLFLTALIKKKILIGQLPRLSCTLHFLVR